MSSVTSITFRNMLKANAKHPHLHWLIRDLALELSSSKINRLKDEENICNRVGELFEFLYKALEVEDMTTSSSIGGVIDGLLGATNAELTADLQKAIYEKEMLEKRITEYEAALKNRTKLYKSSLEARIASLEEPKSTIALQALEDVTKASKQESTTHSYHEFKLLLDIKADAENTIKELLKERLYCIRQVIKPKKGDKISCYLLSTIIDSEEDRESLFQTLKSHPNIKHIL